MYTLDDVGNADRFVAEYGDTVRYVPQFKKWIVWKGTHWAISMGEHYSMAADMVRNLHNEAQDLLVRGLATEHKDLTRHIVRSAGRIDTFLKIAAGYDAIRTGADWLDSDRNYLNARNLTLDLKDGSIQAHSQGDLITKVTNCGYFPNAPRAKWEEFLAQVLPDLAVREYVKRLAGYSLLGDTQERLLVFLYGEGRNGKSVFVETLREVLGDYSTGTPITTFLAKHSETGHNDLARLRGARFIAASEFEEGAKANIALLKQVTGDEKITARPLYGEYFDFPFEGTIWISTNHMPFVGASQAVWDRAKIVEFPTRLADHEVDVNIKAKLQSEAAGILAWMVEGAQAYLAYGLEEPTSVTLASITEREDQNVLTHFFNEACAQEHAVTSTLNEMYRAYEWWCVQSGEKPFSKIMFGKKMIEAGFKKHRTALTWVWQGIRPKSGVQV